MILNRRSLNFSAILALALISTTSSAALAQDDQNAPGGGAPGGFGGGAGGGQGFGRHGRGGFGGSFGAGGGGEQWQQRGPHFPEGRQVLGLQSLTEKQRSQIQQIYDQSKGKFASIREQMKAMRPNGQGGAGQGVAGQGAAGQGGGNQAGADPAQREKFMAMRSQMREARQQTWNDVKKLLTEAQVKELEAMPPSGGGGRFGGQGFGGGEGGQGPGAGFRRGAGRQQLGGGAQGGGQSGGFGQSFRDQPPQQ